MNTQKMSGLYQSLLIIFLLIIITIALIGIATGIHQGVSSIKWDWCEYQHHEKFNGSIPAHYLKIPQKIGFYMGRAIVWDYSKHNINDNCGLFISNGSEYNEE